MGATPTPRNSYLDYFNLQDAGRVFAKGLKNRGDIRGNQALAEALKLGERIR